MILNRNVDVSILENLGAKNQETIMNEVMRQGQYTKIIVAISSSNNREEIAELAGISPRTLDRRFAEREFLQEFSNFNREVRSISAIRLSNYQLPALEKLGELMNAQSEAVQLRAAVALLDLRSKFIVEMEIDSRFLHLEDEIERIVESE